MKNIIILIRPQQWIKNVFIFAGLIFSLQFVHWHSIVKSLLAFIAFVFLSGTAYILNDLIDCREDQLHPAKSKRPIAAGKVTKNTAIFIAVFLTVVSAFIAVLINWSFLIVGAVYLILIIIYSSAVKKVVILDIIFVAFGYVLRAIAGAVAINVNISSWLLLCTMLLALLLVISKRRAEIHFLGEVATKHRPILAQYSVRLLDQMNTIVASACVIAYCLYTLAYETVTKFATRDLIFTVPFVIFGIFRYLYLVGQGGGDMPERLLLYDRPLLICVLLWAGSCLYILLRNYL
ncbi:hypothetical protein A2Y85_05480 [candidate division WOR-3 bacterium RBG_13_43_14]|uniref:Phosphoribose diphosphate--decaprenyl-phosphate phosphoribosyltransferase n=1 Tax=candidate division WOR-3 bacterium RBG_13_43_14 TaxID=1802590 RepID=A0A1F4UF59_UNCW3|nr:MAG: hypothetical protein A2Y85_05480 [candidate division WOR-3 bacterium RBG_13_43_14]